MDWIFDASIWASLFTLTALEIVLGIDNLVFLSVITGRLPENRQKAARRIGLAGAFIMRVILLSFIAWIIALEKPILTLWDGFALSWRDIILLGGGLFLLVKGTLEIHETIEGEEEHAKGKVVTAAFGMAIMQIMVIDMVFSLDSVITAVGMADHLEVMIAAVAISILVMIVAAEPVAAFIERHPTTKMLALSFLLLVGVALLADGLHFHIPRGYLYFAIAFSMMVEGFNLAMRRRRKAARERS